jgi:DNA-binding transcriptional ArsR family regulator
VVKYEDTALDAVFAALADRTRRRVLDQLSGGSLAVTELAAPHAMSLPGFMKHLRVLENAGLIGRTKEGRVVSCELSAAPMRSAAAWMARYEKFWTERLDALARYLYHQEELQPWPKSGSGKSPRSLSPAATPSRRRKSGGRGRTRKR